MAKRLAGFIGLAAAGALASGFATPAHATLALTAAGIADGFTLSTFATIDPGNTGFGPFGLAVNNNNQVMVSDSPTGKVYVFNDVNGQTTGTALFTYSGANSGTVGKTATGGFYYGAAPGDGNSGGTFTRYNANGTVNSSLTGVPYHPYLGMAATPGGHIIATTDSGALIDIDPAGNGGAGSARVITTGLSGDGVSIDPTGTKAIVEVGGVVNVYDIASGAKIGPSLNTSGSPDGTGAISGGAFNGDIVANTNAGNIDLINPTTNTFVTIATGGTRGDYTAADPNGTLLLDYSEAVYRLGIAGGTIGGGTPVPEPASLLLLGAGLAGLGAIRRRK